MIGNLGTRENENGLPLADARNSSLAYPFLEPAAGD